MTRGRHDDAKVAMARAGRPGGGVGDAATRPEHGPVWGVWLLGLVRDEGKAVKARMGGAVQALTTVETAKA